jgi:uncharacterized protein (TIGR02147 family)
MVYSLGTMALPDLYTYLDYRAYLRDWFSAKKNANPRFSHRLFARKAGQKSPSLLLHVVERKRNLTPQTVDAFGQAIGLSGEEADFFAALVQLDQAEDPDERNRAMEKVRATRRFREARRLQGESFEYLSCWYYPAIRELALCPGFQADPEWIAANLRPRITGAQAKKALELLFALGLLKREAEGAVHVADGSVVTPHEVLSLAVHNYHTGMIDRAREALGGFPHTERHFCGVTVAVPASLLPKLKRELDAFQERLLDLCDGASDERTRILQVNLNLFPLSAELPPTGAP